MIRKAGLKDLDRIEEIEKESFDAPWSRASMEAEFYKEFSDVYVWENDGTVNGYIIIWNLKEEGEIVTLAVTSSQRGRGIGKALVGRALENLPEARWRLEVSCRNHAAIALYKKFGFVGAGVIKNYYGEGSDAFRMLRPVLSGQGWDMLSDNGDIIEKLCERSDEFRKLFKEHVSFEQDLEALYSLKYFPPEVERNIKDLKLRKLRGKDRMSRIIERYKQDNNLTNSSERCL